MKRSVGGVFAVLIAGFFASGSLMADGITLPDLPQGDVDTLAIALAPLNGAVDGVAGSSVGWGFTVDFTSSDGDWISFGTSTIGSETEPTLQASYADYIGAQGGPEGSPFAFALSSATGIWAQSFNGTSTGVGAYTIANGSQAGAVDSGLITFNFQIYSGDPNTAAQIGDPNYTYTDPFTVTVDSGTASAPEPGTGSILTGALL